ncbi:MAG: type II secretion system protein GspD [Phycisphaerales bacterium]
MKSHFGQSTRPSHSDQPVPSHGGKLNSAPLGISGLVLLASLWTLGCMQTTDQTRSIEMTSPRVSGGTMLIEPDDSGIGLARIAQALDQIESPQINPGILASIRQQVEAETENQTLDLQQNNESLDSSDSINSTVGNTLNSTHADAPPKAARVTIPSESGRLIPLEKMSIAEIRELIASLSLKIQTEQGYTPATQEQLDLIGDRSEGVGSGPSLARVDAAGKLDLLRLGFVTYTSQLPQLWVQAVSIAAPDANGVRSTAINPDIEKVKPAIDASLAQMKQMRTGLTQADLNHQIIQLSYVNTAGALNTLKGFGINTVPDVQNLPATLDFPQLPIVTKMPSPTKEEMALVGAAANTTGAFGQTTTPTSASVLNPEVYAGPNSQLMVMFHPAHPEQLSMIRSLLDRYVDRPARQVFIEGMVLEISENGLNELGVEWSLSKGTLDFVLGSLDPTGITDTVTFSTLKSRDVALEWGAKVRALVRDGKAEILSRPSVLTLNNRQATIRVGEDIPIATSQEGVLNNSNKVAFNFKYIPTGILLNIRPRITEQGDEVSMLIDTVVSAQVPGRDLEIRSTGGDLLASAPTISTRRVQTYARIDNTTPFIIGGLVSRDRSISKDKVPILGDLPLIGPVFRSESTQTSKREVIIVLTPYVLPEDQVITRAIPRDDNLFDTTGNQLFRDSFRIHAEDVFDLRFLAENKRLMIYRDIARDLINKNYLLAQQPPFSEFADDTIPGEEILIHRMIYELIKRTEIDQRVNPDRIIFFEAKEYEGYDVRFLNYALAKLGDGLDAPSFFEMNPGKALAITYTYARNSLDRQDLASEPIPEISLVDCPNRDTWQQLLWDMNQPSADGLNRYTILINSPKDIVRLQRALMLKKMILLNGDEESLTLKNFTIGKTLHAPKMGPEKVSVIDADVAKYFFHTELYYAAIIKHIEETIEEFNTVLNDPSMGSLLEKGTALPLSEDQ